MSNLNKVFLMGRLTRDPELRYTPQGSAVTDLGLAVNREYSLQNGERRKETTFIDVTVWKRQAEVICQYLKKGSPLFVEGRLSMDSWEGQDGQKRTKIRVVADNFQFIGGRSADGGSADGGSAAGADGGGEGPEGEGASQGRSDYGRSFRRPMKDSAAPAPSAAGEEFGAPKEDDIPF